jgi:hypothetical protein
MKSRGTATDRLADVIQVLQVARKTGILTVTRDAMGNLPEQGIIIFQNGQIMDASLGLLRGSDAFNRLMSWRTCYFVFQAPSSDTPMNGNTGTAYEYERRASNGRLPAYGVPYRLRQAHEVLPYFGNLGFSRAHRQLFLLIDGQRSVQKLMHLMGYRLEEVEMLLADLERAGFIRR